MACNRCKGIIIEHIPGSRRVGVRIFQHGHILQKLKCNLIPFAEEDLVDVVHCKSGSGVHSLKWPRRVLKGLDYDMSLVSLKVGIVVRG